MENIKLISNSVTTVFRNSKLPNKDLLKKYYKKSDKVYCTGDVDGKNNIEEYGIVKLTVDIFNSTIKQERIANAVEIK